jgi:hypothetical protein
MHPEAPVRRKIDDPDPTQVEEASRLLSDDPQRWLSAVAKLEAVATLKLATRLLQLILKAAFSGADINSASHNCAPFHHRDAISTSSS